MRILLNKRENLIALLIIAVGIFISAFIVSAQGDFGPGEGAERKLSGIEFPVAELSNCANKQECKSYCDRPENIEACVAFAKKHGLMDKDHADKALKMSRVLKGGGGPGGCSNVGECKQYCENPDNIEQCLAFAEEHDILPSEELSHAKKMMRMMRNGETPGGCDSRQSCEAYCSSGDHIEECMEFAEKAGIVPGEHIRAARKILSEGGPGGCKSRQECEEFCNMPENTRVCMDFARENGIIDKEEIEHIEENMSRMRLGLEQAPPEIAQCLKDRLGPNIIEDIKNGELVPGPAIGERMRVCFENFSAQNQIKAREHFGDAPPEVKRCLEENVGSEVIDRVKNGDAPPSPEVADEIRGCFEDVREFREDEREREVERHHTDIPGDVRRCLAEKLGPDAIASIEEGEVPEDPERFGQAIRVCSEELAGERHEEGMMGEEEHFDEFESENHEDAVRERGDFMGDGEMDMRDGDRMDRPSR